MLKIGAVCSSGLGSSFMIQMNIETVLRELGISDVSVHHYDLGGASPSDADVWIVGRDLEASAKHLGEVHALNSIIDLEELKTVVAKICQDKGLI